MADDKQSKKRKTTSPPAKAVESDSDDEPLAAKANGITKMHRLSAADVGEDSDSDTPLTTKLAEQKEGPSPEKLLELLVRAGNSLCFDVLPKVRRSVARTSQQQGHRVRDIDLPQQRLERCVEELFQLLLGVAGIATLVCCGHVDIYGLSMYSLVFSHDADIR